MSTPMIVMTTSNSISVNPRRKHRPRNGNCNLSLLAIKERKPARGTWPKQRREDPTIANPFSRTNPVASFSKCS